MMSRVWAAALTAMAVVGMFLVLAVSQYRAPATQVIVVPTAGGALTPTGSVRAGSPPASVPAPVASAGIPTTRSS
jgi:hypothetical protein